MTTTPVNPNDVVLFWVDAEGNPKAQVNGFDHFFVGDILPGMHEQPRFFRTVLVSRPECRPLTFNLRKSEGGGKSFLSVTTNGVMMDETGAALAAVTPVWRNGEFLGAYFDDAIAKALESDMQVSETEGEETATGPEETEVEVAEKGLVTVVQDLATALPHLWVTDGATSSSFDKLFSDGRLFPAVPKEGRTGEIVRNNRRWAGVRIGRLAPKGDKPARWIISETERRGVLPMADAHRQAEQMIVDFPNATADDPTNSDGWRLYPYWGRYLT